MRMGGFVQSLRPGRYFISHSYRDSGARERLLASLPQGVEPVIFAPISVAPHEFVSTPLMDAISACDGLITVRGKHSLESFWARFEREYAIRNQLAVYSWDSVTEILNPDGLFPTDLAVYLSYAAADHQVVAKVARQMGARSFDVSWGHNLYVSAGDERARAIRAAIENLMKRGGHLILFNSRSTRDSLWVKTEVEYARTIGNGRIVVACIDDEPLSFGLQLPPEDHRLVKLWDGEKISNNRIDDLVVRLYWLAFRNRLTN